MKKNTELLQNSLPLIGAGLGDKLGVKISVQGNQAWTDGNTINIPSFNVSSKEEKDAVLGYMSHEAAHIKFDSFKDVERSDITVPIRKILWNIFEDLRIEKAMIESMIGTKKWMNQIWANRQKNGREPVDGDSAPISIICDLLLFHCRVNHRGQTHLQPYLDAAEDAFIGKVSWKLHSKLMALLDKKLDSLSSSVDAMNLAKEVELLLEQHDEDEDSKQSEQEQSVGSESENSEQEKNETSLSKAEIERAVTAILDATEKEIEDDMTAFASTMETLAIANKAESVAIPEVKSLPTIKKGSGDELLQSCKKTSNQLTATLQGVVQEQLMTRSKTATNGNRLNSKVLYRAATGDARLFKTKQKRKQVDTIVEIALDNSGSMVNRRLQDGRTLLEVAKDSQVALAVALEKIAGVSVTASAFPATKSGYNVFEVLKEDESAKKYLSDRLTASYGQGGHTPSASAMWHCIKTVMQSRMNKKVIIFITDGPPNNNEHQALIDLVKQAEKSGVVVIGVAIGAIAEKPHLITQYFNNSLFIQDIRELKKEMFNIARKVVVD